MIAADPIAEKRKQVLKIGADLAFDPTAPDFREQVLAACPLADSGIYTGERASGVKVAIEVTGVGAGPNSVLDVMAPMGRVALLGCTHNSDFSVDYYHKVHGRGIARLGTYTFDRLSESSAALVHRDSVGTGKLIEYSVRFAAYTRNSKVLATKKHVVDGRVRS